MEALFLRLHVSGCDVQFHMAIFLGGGLEVFKDKKMNHFGSKSLLQTQNFLYLHPPHSPVSRDEILQNSA